MSVLILGYNLLELALLRCDVNADQLVLRRILVGLEVELRSIVGNAIHLS